MQDKISVVLPVYNGERYLCESIESVLCQTYCEWELILVNDCSTDRTLDIMKDYENRDSRIKVVCNNENQKLPKSLNIGFKTATGKYFTWTSDDNRYKPEALEQMKLFLEKNPDIGLVYADMDYIDEMGKKIGEVSIDAEEIYYDDCVRACFLYRSDVAKLTGEYDPNRFLVEDYEYWLRMSEKSKLAHLPVNLYEYRYHDVSLTATKSRGINEQLYRLRMEKLDFILERIGEKQKEALFVDICAQNRGELLYFKKKFYGDSGLPQNIKWVERDRKLKEDKPIILFGAGIVGRKALKYWGENKIAFFADNNPKLIGKELCNRKIISFEKLKKIHKDYQIVISAISYIVIEIANQLEANGIKEFVTYLEIVSSLY